MQLNKGKGKMFNFLRKNMQGGNRFLEADLKSHNVRIEIHVLIKSEEVLNARQRPLFFPYVQRSLKRTEVRMCSNAVYFMHKTSLITCIEISKY